MNDSSEFQEFIKKCWLEEHREDATPIQKCSAFRRSMACIHMESLDKLSNEETCFILKKNLAKYSQMVSDDSTPDAVNYFAKPLQSLIHGKVQIDHCSSWKFGLNSSDIDPVALFNENMIVDGNCDQSSCRSNSLSDEKLKMFFSNKKKENNLLPTIFSHKENTFQRSNNNDNYNSNFRRANITRNNVNENLNVSENCNPNFNRINLTRSSVNENTNFNDNHNPNYNKVNTTKCSVNENMNINDNYNPNYNRANITRNNVNESMNFKDNFNSNFNRTSIQKSTVNGNTNFNKNPNLNRYKMFTQKEDNSTSNNLAEDCKPRLNSFKTAKEEYQLQRIKNGNNANDNQQLHAPKRSLGMTGSGKRKFTPPAPAHSQEFNEEYSNENIDERLKHIDPKMVEMITSEILDSGAPISWDDIAGLDFAKTAIQEAVVWPLLRPDIFTGLRRPPRGILLFGPPGTGKTLIAKCIASQCNATFFSISASSLMSKWLGEAEKMVRALFAVARCHQPAVVFIDEIDSLLTQRSDSEHETSRRVKTEFLVQLDGAAIGDEDRMLLIGATNRPQELDEAARRRLVKRLYIPLPDLAARKQIISRLMSSERNSLTDQDIVNIAEMANGFSGADMRSLCAEAALEPIRSIPFQQIANIQSDQVRPVGTEDFKKALTRVRPSVSQDDLEPYIKWDATYGSGSSIIC